jgi:uncharacterized protein involved in outer membrane biogenesis
MRRTARRVLRYGAATLVVLAALAMGAALVLPMLLDSPARAAEIQARLSRAVKGEVRWNAFVLRILPAPHATLHGLRVETNAATLTSDEVNVSLALWPLFRGRAEIRQVALAKPMLRLTIVPAAAVPKEAQVEPEEDPLQAYRSIMQALVDALREFAPDTVVDIREAAVSITVEGMPPIELSGLALRALTDGGGVKLDASAASRYWTSMKLNGRIRYADLSSDAELHLRRLQGQAWLDWVLKASGVGVAIPNADVSARFHGDPGKALELEFDGTAPTLSVTHGTRRIAAAPLVLKGKISADALHAALQLTGLQAGASRLTPGVVRYVRKDGSIEGDLGYAIDLPQALGYAREFAPGALARVTSAKGTLQGRAKVEERRFGLSVDKSDAALEVKDLPGPFRLAGGRVEVDAKALRVEAARVALPAGEVVLTRLDYLLKNGNLTADAQFDLDLAQTLALVRAALPGTDLSVIEAAGGRVRGKGRGELAGKGWSATAEVAQSDAQAKLKPLPAPVRLAGASVRASPGAVNIERAQVALLDATATASATLSAFDRGVRVQGAVSQARVGGKLLDWVWTSQQISPGLQPRTPIAATVRRFSWGPAQSLQLEATAQFETGAAVGVDLAWSPDALDVRRATIKDARSDATVSLRSKGKVLEGRYAGTLDSRTLAAMLKSARAPAGAMSGKLHFTFDRNQPQRTAVEGTLKGENVDLSWLAGQPAKLERLDLAADGMNVQINEATVDWASQRATLRGTGARSDGGLVIDAQIESPGVVVDALLPKTKSEGAKGDPWPLPVTGKVTVSSKFVQYGTYKVEPFVAVLHLERERAGLEVNEAFVCGFALPARLEVTPQGYSARTVIAAEKQKLEEAAKCLSGEKVLLTGPVDLRADLRTQGRADELLQNLKGTVSADVRNGTVTKFALLGNILSMQNVVALVGQGGPKLDTESFPFRQLSARGHFEKGRFVIDEGVFHSNAVGLGANGWISLADLQTRLTVLVAPLALVDEAVRKLPVLGYVIGGTFTSLPVSVTGDIRDPTVVPLGPRAITSELTGILGRTLSLPGRLVPGEQEKP